MIEIVPATRHHARAIDLRPGDLREIEALGMTRDEALQGCLDRSLWAEAYLVDGEVAALMGVILPSLLGAEPAVAWLMTGRPVDRCRKDFLRITRARVREMLEQHGTLTCNVHAEYTGAIRWLRWLGFAIAPARGVFHEATLRKGLHIGPTCIANLFEAPNWKALVGEYAEESNTDGLPPPSARFETYDAMEKAAILHTFDARLDGLLVGFITVMGHRIPHYDRIICLTESFFVSKAHRNHLTGLKLLSAAEEKAHELKSLGLLVSAPYGGKLFELLPRCGYAEVGRSFFKKVNP